jgi:hypothetical protein
MASVGDGMSPVFEDRTINELAHDSSLLFSKVNSNSINYDDFDEYDNHYFYNSST